MGRWELVTEQKKNSPHKEKDFRLTAAYKKRLLQLEIDYDSAIAELELKIKRAERHLKEVKSKNLKELIELELNSMQERLDIANNYHNLEFPDRAWLLERVLNDGEFLEYEELASLKEDMLEREILVDPDFYKRLKLSGILTAIFAFGGPAITLLIPVIGVLLMFFGDVSSSVCCWMVLEYPLCIFLPFLSWGTPLICWGILPWVFEFFLLTPEERAIANKYDANSRGARKFLLGVAMLQQAKTLIEFVKGPKLKD